MSQPKEKISQKEIYFLKEEIENAKKDIAHYEEEIEFKARCLEELKERAKWKLNLYEERLKEISEGLSKEQREDLI